MGKTSKPPSDSSKAKSVIPPLFKPNAPPVNQQSNDAKHLPIPNKNRRVEMPSSADGVTASTLSSDQKNIVKKSVQKLFRNDYIQASKDPNCINALDRATDNLSKLMEEAAAKRKLQKQLSKAGKNK